MFSAVKIEQGWSKEVGDWLINQGYALSDCDGVKIADHSRRFSLGIRLAKNTVSATRRSAWFKGRPEKNEILICIVYFSVLHGARPNHWVLEVVSIPHTGHIVRLAIDIEEKFNVEVEIHRPTN